MKTYERKFDLIRFMRDLANSSAFKLNAAAWGDSNSEPYQEYSLLNGQHVATVASYLASDCADKWVELTLPKMYDIETGETGMKIRYIVED